MEIRSTDHKSKISIDISGSDPSYISIELKATIDIGHGFFTAKNFDVHFLNLNEFLKEFNRFILDRSILPRLDGTYDSFLEFKEISSRVYCDFCIGDTFCGNRTVDFKQTGSFEIDQDFLNRIYEELDEIRLILQ